MSQDSLQPNFDPFGVRQKVFVQSVGNPVGFKAFSPGRWGLVGATVTNRTEQTKVIQATAFVNDNEQLRFSRDVVVPPMTTRSTTIPIHIPAELAGSESVELTGKVVSGEEVQPLTLDFLARMLAPSSMAYINDLPGEGDGPVYGFDFSYECAIAVREAVGLDRRLVLFSDRLLPTSVEGWDAVDVIVLAGDRTAVSPAACQALRQWVSEGGRMWIQLDHTSPSTVRGLLGSALEFDVIDKVWLNSFQLEFAEKKSKAVPVQIDLEDPVQLRRMVVDNAEVLYSIDGWPAMFRIPYGKGEIYFTALDCRGWIRPRAHTDRPFSDPLFYTDFVGIEPLRDLSAILRSDPPATMVEDSIAQQFTTSRIGYQIPSRTSMISVLLGFCVAIVAGSFLLSIMQKREWLSLFTVVTGVLAAGLILLAGVSSKQGVPATSSSFQVVEVLPQSAEYIASGQLAVFNGQPSEAQFEAREAIRINPQSEVLTGKIRNLVWSDASRWSWKETSLPPGVQIVEFNKSHSLSEPVHASAALGPKGLEGRIEWKALLDGGSQLLEGGILVFPGAPALAANLESDGSFHAGIDDTLSAGQYFTSTFTTDDQRRQQPVLDEWYRNYLDSRIQQPYLLAWIDNLGTGLDWPEELRVLDASLVAIPLVMQPTVGEIDVDIPASLIVLRSIGSATGQSSVFDNAQRTWLHPFTRESSTRIRFQLPQQTLPLKVTGAQLEIDCNIPSRTLEVFAMDGNQAKLIAKRSNPAGIISINIEQAELPPLDDLGGLVLEFSVSELTNQFDETTVANSAWSIRKTLLSVSGTHQSMNQQ